MLRENHNKKINVCQLHNSFIYKCVSITENYKYYSRKLQAIFRSAVRAYANIQTVEYSVVTYPYFQRIRSRFVFTPKYKPFEEDLTVKFYTIKGAIFKYYGRCISCVCKILVELLNL